MDVKDCSRCAICSIKLVSSSLIRDLIFLTLSGPAFSVVRQAWGWLRGPDAKNQGYHHPIEMRVEMKLCVSQYSHESMSDAKFESGSFSSYGDMTSQKFPRKRGISHSIRIFTPGKWI